MKILVSKILIIFLLISFTSEMAISAFANNTSLGVMLETDDSEEKKEEEKKEQEESKDKISSVNTSVEFATVSDGTFPGNHFFKTSAFKSLPEIPPDQA